MHAFLSLLLGLGLFLGSATMVRMEQGVKPGATDQNCCSCTTCTCCCCCQQCGCCVQCGGCEDKEE